ncbi:SDR family oxidoreductase, partial [Vibrio alfacsensis]
SMTAQMKPEARERLEHMVPVRRMADPSEIAHTVRFILENEYVNGRVIEVDGGLVI